MKKIIFVTASRADYGKLKNLIVNLQKKKNFKVYVIVTGMHNLKKFGSTWMKIKLKKYDNIKNVIRFKNQFNNDKMDNILAKTILGFTKIVKKINPDLIIVHGDRIEPLACASVGALNNFKIGHIEVVKCLELLTKFLDIQFQNLPIFTLHQIKKLKED